MPSEPKILRADGQPLMTPDMQKQMVNASMQREFFVLYTTLVQIAFAEAMKLPGWGEESAANIALKAYQTTQSTFAVYSQAAAKENV